MSATASVSLLVLLQLGSRVLNFGLSTALARGLGPRWFGLANVQLQLVSASALFLSREGLRRACQRVYPGGGGAALAHGANLAWLAVPLSALSAAAVGGYFGRAGADGGATAALVPPEEYSAAVWLICAAAVVESAAEPAWLYAQANNLISRRVLAEGAALALRAAATVWLALGLRLGARAFGYAQLLYALLYTAGLYALLPRRLGKGGSLWPRRAAVAEGGGGGAAAAATATTAAACWLPAGHRATASLYCLQSVQKYVLTEGERLVLVWLSPLAQQGVFALVSNLGSLVARLVLAPLEEVAFARFSAAAAAGEIDGAALTQLHVLLRGASIFGGVFLAFGPPYSWLLLTLLYGSEWTSLGAHRLLGVYCAHVCAMSVNGVAEAFVNATASPEQLKALSKAMFALSALYVPLAAALLTLGGSAGLVVANVLNLVGRIVYAFLFIREATKKALKPTDALPRLLPHKAVLASLAGSAAATSLAGLALGTPQSAWAHHAAHVAVGGACLVVVGLTTLRAEPELIAALRAARRGRKKQD